MRNVQTKAYPRRAEETRAVWLGRDSAQMTMSPCVEGKGCQVEGVGVFLKPNYTSTSSVKSAKIPLPQPVQVD